MIIEELKDVHATLTEECQHLQQQAIQTDSIPIYITDHDRNKRLLFLFQRDLLPGISGQILETKDKRDDQTLVSAVWWGWKYAAWFYLIAQNLGMIFYVLLFALSQTEQRQDAWVRSFIIWLIMEVIVISTAMVLLMHIMLPAMLMKDVQCVREKLTQSIEQYHEKLVVQQSPNAASNDSNSKQKKSKKPKANEFYEFNAAKYLFVSYRLAQEFPSLTIAKVILQYSSSWPKQSYQHIHDVSKDYSKRFTALYRSASVVAIFFLSNLLSVPFNIQDMAINLCTTVFLGYMVVLQVQLYHISPILVMLPYLFIACCIYGIIRMLTVKSKKSNRDLVQLRGSPIVHREESDENESESDDDNDNDSNIADKNEESPSFSEARNDVIISKDMIKEKKAKYAICSVDCEEGEEEDRLNEPLNRPIQSSPMKSHQTRRQSVQHGMNILRQANQELLNNDMKHSSINEAGKSINQRKKLLPPSSASSSLSSSSSSSCSHHTLPLPQRNTNASKPFADNSERGSSHSNNSNNVSEVSDGSISSASFSSISDEY